MNRDPVCLMPITPTHAMSMVEFGGRSYYFCSEGVREAGGSSIGISPALSLNEHVHKYHSPSDAYELLIYMGSGLMGREVTNIRSAMSRWMRRVRQ